MKRLNPNVLIPLSAVTSVEEAGAKAASLAELARHGIPVPGAFVIPPSVTTVPGRQVLEALGGRVAVRSSATAEDLTDASFAGQFRSFLNICTIEELELAIRKCRDSLGSDGVRAYCDRHGLDASQIRMAVIVQRMLKAKVAGVLFTIHPVRGHEDEMLIEACKGLADGLLSGRASGVQIPVRGGHATHPTDLLSKEQVQQLITIGGRIQQLKGAPQDIEWAIEGDHLYILQARPITRLCFSGVEGDWTNADFRDGGVSSGVVTPLMWSLYEFVLQRALNGYLKQLKLLKHDIEAGRVIYGRPYWNLGAVKRCMQKLPGFVEREFDCDLGVQPTYTGDGVRTPITPWSILRAIPTALAAARVIRVQAARDLRLLDDDLTSLFEIDFRALGDGDLVWLFSELVEKTYLTVEENYFRTIFCTSIAKQDLKTFVEDKPLSYTKLVGGLNHLRHFECAQALWDLANRNVGSMESFLKQYGHHSRRELDLRVPRWSEDPETVRDLARTQVGAENPANMNRRQHELFAAELARARCLFHPWKRRRFEAKLERLRRYVWLREQMRDLSTRIYALIRRFVLEIGGRAALSGCLGTTEDVFYLTSREMYEVVRVPMHDRVKRRRDYEEMYRTFRAPNEVGQRFRLAPVEHNGPRLTGIGCSSGVASGRVSIVKNLRDAPKLERDHVLVCPFIDPGWTPLLNVAAAVVTESGGQLSHAAVLCREYGIPAVLNVPGVTRVLQDGQVVRVNGETGSVDVL